MTEWHVRLQFEDIEPSELDENTLDALMDLLEVHAPVLTMEPGRLSFFLSLDASSPDPASRSARSAVRSAMKEAGVAAPRIPVAVEIYSSEELDRLNAIPNYPEVVGVAEVAAMLGVSKQRVSELARSRKFPSPLYELAAGPIWVKPTVEAFVETWNRKPGRPKRVATG